MNHVRVPSILARCVGAVCAAASVACVAPVAAAADVPWIKTGNGAYQVGLNWLGGVVPTTSNRAVFSLPLSNTVWFNASASTGSLLVESGDVTLDLNGESFALTDLTSTVVVGQASIANPTLRLREGTLTAATTDVGLNSNATGTLEIGPDATWQTTLDTRIAYAQDTTGHLRVHGGGALNALRDLYIGYLNGATGSAVVEGANSRLLVTREINLGMDSTGSLHVHTGGRVTGKDIYLARSPRANAEFIVEGPASSAAFVFKLSVGSGFRANADLRIDNGADVYSFFGVLGEIQESVGEARVLNGAHWEIENAFYVGFRATGDLLLDSGATLSSKFTNIGYYNNSSGHARIRGEGTLWQNLQHINVGVAANTTGALVVENGATVESATVVVGPNGSLTGDGVVEALVTNNGLIEPGLPGDDAGAPSNIGALTIRGGYAQTPGAGGALRAQIGGLSPGDSHDILIVEGAATLGGSLDVEFVNGFNPQMGDTFALISASTITGSFDSVSLPMFTDGRFCILFSNGHTLYLTVLQGLIPPPHGPATLPIEIDIRPSENPPTDTPPVRGAPPGPVTLSPESFHAIVYAVLNSHARGE